MTMLRPETALTGLQLCIGVFAVIGCIVASFNYGLDYPSYMGDEIFTNLSRFSTDLPVGSPTHEVIGHFFDKVDNLMRAFRFRARYQADSRTYVMLPMLASAAMSSVLSLWMIFDKSVLTSTSIINSICAMWLLHFPYLISFTNTHFYSNDEAVKYFSSSYSAVLTLHMIMITLLTVGFAANAYYIRHKRIAWPRCNCYKLFTINSLFICARLVYASILLPSGSEVLFSGIRSDPSNTKYCIANVTLCGTVRLPASVVFGATGALVFSVMGACEALLSLLFGFAHEVMTLGFALLTSLANFIVTGFVSEYGLLSYGQMPWAFGIAFMGQCAVALLHAWLMWSAPAFINSAPNVLKLVCGYKPKPADDVQPTNELSETGADEDVENTIHAEQQENNDTVTTSENNTTNGEVQARKLLISKAFRFCINFTIAVVALVSLSMSGFTIAETEALDWCQLLLVVVLTVVVSRAVVSVMVTVSSAPYCATSTVQTAMEEAIVIGLLIVSAVATRFYQISAITNDATYVTIVVLVLKMADLSQCQAFRNLFSSSSNPTNTPVGGLNHDRRSLSVQSDTNTLSSAST